MIPTARQLRPGSTILDDLGRFGFGFGLSCPYRFGTAVPGDRGPSMYGSHWGRRSDHPERSRALPRPGRDATRISRSLLSLIETGRSDITIGRLTRLAPLHELASPNSCPAASPRPDRRPRRRPAAASLHGRGDRRRGARAGGPAHDAACLRRSAPLARMQGCVPQAERANHAHDRRTDSDRGQRTARGWSSRQATEPRTSPATAAAAAADLVDDVTRMLIVIQRPRLR